MAGVKPLSTNKSKVNGNIIFQIVVIIMLVVAGGGVCFWFFNHKPKPKKKKAIEEKLLVRTMKLSKVSHDVKIKAMGEISAARTLKITPRISGMIIKCGAQIIPGQIIKANQLLWEIDQADYKIAKAIKFCELQQAKYNVKLEMGQQEIARKEFESLGGKFQTDQLDLVLRKPQLEQVKAKQKAAQSAYDKACLDLERTKIQAPFNSIVGQKLVEVGTQVTPGTGLAVLHGTDQYWLTINLPVSQLKWIRFPNAKGRAGSKVKIYNKYAWGEKAYRTGEILRLASQLETNGRMAKVIVKIDDPLCLKPENKDKPKLILGMFVTADILGKKIQNVYKIPRGAFRHGKSIWLFTSNANLEVRKVNPIYLTETHAFFLSGMKDNEKLIVNNIPRPALDAKLVEINKKAKGK